MIEEDDDGDVQWTKTNVFLHLRRQFKVRKTAHDLRVAI
jgi:hypothetical protein